MYIWLHAKNRSTMEPISHSGTVGRAVLIRRAVMGGLVMRIHPSLVSSARRQTEAAPENWEATYRQMVLFDLAADVELGFFLAYYRNFAIPSIAATLQRNGEITQRPVNLEIS